MSIDRTDIDELHELIDNNSFDKYYIKHHGFQVNHMAHGQIALYRLDAPMEAIKNFTEHYSSLVENKGGELHQKQDAKIETVESVEGLKGEATHYYEILDHMKDLFKKKYNNNLDQFIVGEFPPMRLGIAQTALHPVIHMGYGYSVGSATVVLEGMAFLHFNYFPIKLADYSSEKLGRGSKSLLEVATLIQQDDEIVQTMKDNINQDWVKKITYNGFSDKLISLHGACGDKLLEYVHMLDCPREPLALQNWIIDQSITLYQISNNRNDFFLLHGITGSWALGEFLPLIKCKEQKMETLQAFLCALLAVYIAQERPGVELDRLENPDVSDISWEDLLNRVHSLKPSADEHIHKVVQCCYDSYKRNPLHSDLYKRASLTVLENPFHYFKRPPTAH